MPSSEQSKMLWIKRWPYIFGNPLDAKNQSTETLVASVIDYYDSIIGCMPGNVYWLDKNCLTVGCNQNVLRMLGLNSIAEFTGLTFEQMAEAGHWSRKATRRFKKDSLEVLATGQPKFNIEEEPIPDAEGKLVHFLTNRVPLFNSNKEIIGVVGISIDITERKKMEADLITAKEQAESALKAKSDFFAVVSHELRTPLTGILGMTELLLAQPSQSETGRVYLTHVNNASKHLLSLINNILDFSKLNDEQFSLKHVPFDLRDVFNQVFNMLHVKAIEKNLFLTLDYSTDYARYFVGDPRALMQVLINLVGNAIKFTQSGGISLKVTEEKRTATHAQMNISVTDTGMGIPEEHLVSIFKRFEQLGAMQTSVEFGTGLGLLVSQKIVNLMGSEIFVKSIIGEGSTFSMQLNLELSPEIVLSDYESTDEAIKPLKQTGLKLLLVEDDFLIQTIHKLKLSQYGFNISMAADAEEALALCATMHFDLIFIDIGLPRISGTELIKKIRKDKGLNADTLIIALTAYADENNHISVLHAGANGALCKPVTNKMFNDLFANCFSENTASTGGGVE